MNTNKIIMLALLKSARDFLIGGTISIPSENNVIKNICNKFILEKSIAKRY